MTNKILCSIYNLCFYIDNKLGYIESYDYETAPYCGHHYDGHKGKLTASDYHEGDGEKYCIFLFWVVAKCTEDKKLVYTNKKAIQ